MREGASRWHLLLVVPFLTLVTPWFNAVEPRLAGVPFFYWVQFAWIPITAGCLAVVHLLTRRPPGASRGRDRPFTAP